MAKTKKKNGKAIVVLTLIIVIFASIIFGGYLVIDKVVVPKYLSSYGINNLGELVTMVRTMYNSPKESDFITNPFTEADRVSGFNTLKSVGFPVNDNKTSIDYNKIASTPIEIASEQGNIKLTDREIASILNDILKSGALVSNLDAVESLDTLSMEVKEVVISPIEKQESESADISLTILVDTEKVREDMAVKMDVPLFLLNMIVPSKLYFTCEFEIEKYNDGEYNYDNCIMKINGTTAQQSEILINLLINFIFDDSENMTMTKLTEELGNMVFYGLDLIGDFEFAENIGVKSNQNGIIVHI